MSEGFLILGVCPHPAKVSSPTNLGVVYKLIRPQQEIEVFRMLFIMEEDPLLLINIMIQLFKSLGVALTKFPPKIRIYS